MKKYLLFKKHLLGRLYNIVQDYLEHFFYNIAVTIE